MAVASGRVAAPALVVPSSRWRGRGAQVGAIFALMVVAYFILRNDFPWPASLTWAELEGKLDDAQEWLLEQRTAANPNIIFAILDGFRAFAEWLVNALLDFFVWLTWVGTIVAGTLIVLRYGGWRAALVVLAAFVTFAITGLWEQSIQTLALMTAAVLLSLAVGVPIGIYAGRNERFHRAITPVLDAMQIVPAFAYLMPIVILFSVGPA
jgi:glycine betaine/proline transport system permease protein